ncbi:acyl-CoA dehydrogenase family member 11-like [Tubulanus polymorphus]|uniref:acyl-CoA dehydrogenase family member 11-like n=1 Tax=Tubulanus polymorphus TaxID=672921 RepID=UPI003DA6B9EB
MYLFSRFRGYDLKRLIKPSQGYSLSYSLRRFSRDSIRSSQSENLSSKTKFAKTKTGDFLQPEPTLSNQFTTDYLLVRYLQRVLPIEVQHSIFPDLKRFGNRVATDIYDLHLQCEKNEPYLKQYDAWGRRIDQIITCDAWKSMKSISAEEGLINIAYHRQYAQYSRVYQAVKLYLFSPSSGLFSCPLAMTDGASKILQDVKNNGRLESAYKRLTSRDKQEFWTSGQWMTERKGGSDVGNGTETVAVAAGDGIYRLYGFKWFTSATDSDMTFTLARILNDQGQPIQGSKGLTMFYLETLDSENGNLNGIEIQKLKNKLGTRQLPTAELLLEGAKAIRVSDEGRGVADISTMLTITRIHNALSSVSAMRRVIQFARDYSTKRQAFGKTICDYPLHVQTLAAIELETRGCFLYIMEVVRLLGLNDCNQSTDHELHMLRLLTPLVKLYTAKQAVAVTSEGLECFGGQGYIEDTGLPSLLRDSQVLPIWEGTTNILSLDVLRSLVKSNGQVLKEFVADVENRLSLINRDDLYESVNKIRSALNDVMKFTENHQHQLQTAARHFSFTLSRIYIGMLLLEQAAWDQATDTDVTAAIRWCKRADLCPVLSESCYYSSPEITRDWNLVMNGYEEH